MTLSSEARQQKRRHLVELVNKADAEFEDADQQYKAARRAFEVDATNLRSQKSRALKEAQAELKTLLGDDRA